MKKTLLLFITGIISSAIVCSFIRVQVQHETNTLEKIVSLTDNEQQIVVKQNDYIIYDGTVRNIPSDILEKQLIEYASCDDTENTITYLVE